MPRTEENNNNGAARRLPVLCLRVPCNDSCTRLLLVTEDSLITVQGEKPSSSPGAPRFPPDGEFKGLRFTRGLNFCCTDSCCCHFKLGPNQSRGLKWVGVILILDPRAFPYQSLSIVSPKESIEGKNGSRLALLVPLLLILCDPIVLLARLCSLLSFPVYFSLRMLIYRRQSLRSVQLLISRP